MKAKVIREFRVGRKVFLVGDIVNIKDDAVFIEDENYWLCDVDSPYFNERFEMLNQ